MSRRLGGLQALSTHSSRATVSERRLSENRGAGPWMTTFEPLRLPRRTCYLHSFHGMFRVARLQPTCTAWSRVQQVRVLLNMH